MILLDTSLVIDTSLSSTKKSTLFSRLSLSESTITSSAKPQTTDKIRLDGRRDSRISCHSRLVAAQ